MNLRVSQTLQGLDLNSYPDVALLATSQTDAAGCDNSEALGKVGGLRGADGTGSSPSDPGA